MWVVISCHSVLGRIALLISLDTEDVTESKQVQWLMLKMTLSHQGRLNCDHNVLFKLGNSEVYFRIIIKIVKIMQKKSTYAGSLIISSSWVPWTLGSLWRLLKLNREFGECVCFSGKRGHSFHHILKGFYDLKKLRMAEVYEKFICSEILMMPDKWNVMNL